MTKKRCVDPIAHFRKIRAEVERWERVREHAIKRREILRAKRRLVELQAKPEFEYKLADIDERLATVVGREQQAFEQLHGLYCNYFDEEEAALRAGMPIEELRNAKMGS